MDRIAAYQKLARGVRINNVAESTKQHPNPMNRILLLLTALVFASNAIAGSCYVRKACLALINDSAICSYKA